VLLCCIRAFTAHPACAASLGRWDATTTISIETKAEKQSTFSRQWSCCITSFIYIPHFIWFNNTISSLVPCSTPQVCTALQIEGKTSSNARCFTVAYSFNCSIKHYLFLNTILSYKKRRVLMFEGKSGTGRAGGAGPQSGFTGFSANTQANTNTAVFGQAAASQAQSSSNLFQSSSQHVQSTGFGFGASGQSAQSSFSASGGGGASVFGASAQPPQFNQNAQQPASSCAIGASPSAQTPGASAS
jgi:hypothetical protein